MTLTFGVAAGGAVRPRGRAKSLVAHVAGLSLAICGLGIVSSAVVDAVDRGPDVGALALSGLAIALVGALVWRSTTIPDRIRNVDVFAAVTAAWAALAVAGAIPYLVTGAIPTFDNALFESVSGFTTTGATVLRPIEGHSAGLLFWRALSQWLGGMGVIVLVVAALPAVGSGGMHLLQAEAPGPTGERLTPRVRHTARRLWGFYIGLSVVVALAYGAAGMSLYDAVAHSFTTVSTGGFSPYNRSLGHFDSAVIEWIAIVAMFIAGGNFTLYYRALRGRAGPLLKSVEFRVYALIVAVATLICFTTSGGGSSFTAFRGALFSVVSVSSTTGYATDDFGLWLPPAQVVLLLLMPVGAMSGSTAGGVKVIRVLAVGSHAYRETLRQLHPRLVRPVRIGRDSLDETIANKVLGFLVLALTVFGSAFFLTALTGSDVLTSFAAAATSYGNVGPGMGDIGPTADFLELARPARWVSMVTMLFGRLEIYPLLLAVAALPRPTRLWRLLHRTPS